MDRRSWLWRRKSSEKSPSGETESSGSLSSFSERFSDDQALPNHNVQSPEVTSKARHIDELDDTVKTLSDKLSDALLNIRAKEDLVKQHSKVAEEAVSGWEKAENEVLALKKQKEALTQKNSSLEERVDHLDGALKECLRQLRQSREEQEDMIAKKSREWETKKAQLENQFAELQAQLQLSKTDTILLKLEASEKENSILKLKLFSKDEELELRTNERDLSTRAAESASKQHLESIKRVSKLEAECRKLKLMARKANEQRSSVAASSIGVESFTDSQSDNGERILAVESCDSEAEAGQSNKIDKKLLEKSSPFGSSIEINMMDDFLEMEKLAAIPETQVSSERVDGREEVEAMVKRTADLEENLRKVTEEKVSLEIALNECRIQLNTSGDRLNQTMSKLVDMKMQLAVADEEKREVQREVGSMKVKLKNSAKLLDEREITTVRIQDQLAEAKRRVEAKLEDADLKRADAESRLELMEHELETLRTEIFTLEREVEKEKSFSREADDKCKILESEIARMESAQDQLAEAKRRVEAKLEDADLKRADAESRLELMEHELETLRSEIFTLEREVEKEKSFSREADDKCKILESEIARMESASKEFQRSAICEEFRINQDKELAVAASKFAECQKTIASLDRQLKSLATFEDFTIETESPVTVI